MATKMSHLRVENRYTLRQIVMKMYKCIQKKLYLNLYPYFSRDFFEAIVSLW